jgi:hypothetical protein
LPIGFAANDNTNLPVLGDLEGEDLDARWLWRDLTLGAETQDFSVTTTQPYLMHESYRNAQKKQSTSALAFWKARSALYVRDGV